VVTSLDETVGVTDQGDTLVETLNGMICFDAAIEPGDSGGPLFNHAGQVIGMDTAKQTQSNAGASGGWGCAIPITRAMTIARQIIAGVSSPYIESGHRGWLGVDVANTADQSGAVVTSVAPGAAAAGGGIKDGDVITGIGGISVHSIADLDAAMKGRRPGDHVAVAWLDASGATHQGTVTLSPGPPA
jgi:S1-C subfamily serine protease